MPDYYAEAVVEWRWIIYPWAVIEDLTSFLHEMEPRPTSVDAFAAYLLERYGIEAAKQTLEDVLALDVKRGAFEKESDSNATYLSFFG